MEVFFTLALGSICHHLQLLHKPHFGAFRAIFLIPLTGATARVVYPRFGGHERRVQNPRVFFRPDLWPIRIFLEVFRSVGPVCRRRPLNHHPSVFPISFWPPPLLVSTFLR